MTLDMLNPAEAATLLKEMHVMKGSMFRRALEIELDRSAIEQDNCRDDVALRWIQGKRQYLRELIKDIDSSTSNLEKLTVPRPNMGKAF